MSEKSSITWLHNFFFKDAWGGCLGFFLGDRLPLGAMYRVITNHAVLIYPSSMKKLFIHSKTLILYRFLYFLSIWGVLG